MLLDVVDVEDYVSIYLDYIYLKEEWILDSRMDQQGGAEVIPLPAHPKILRILCSLYTHDFL